MKKLLNKTIIVLTDFNTTYENWNSTRTREHANKHKEQFKNFDKIKIGIFCLITAIKLLLTKLVLEAIFETAIKSNKNDKVMIETSSIEGPGFKVEGKTR